jgi:hypothetical protein
MTKQEELQVLIDRYDTDYNQKIIDMKESRIGGEAKYVMKVMRDPIMSHHSQDLPQQLIDGCVLRAANDLFNALTSSSKHAMVKFFGVKDDELTPYHLTIIVDTEAAGIMNDLGVRSVAEYIQKNGFEDYIIFILAVGRNLIKQLPDS